MIVGRGDIAQALQEVDREDLLFFASGVSNSAETHLSEFGREIETLLDQPRELRTVYFSSLSILYSSTPYARHKHYMEGMVKGRFRRHTIVRLGNIAFGNNPNTIINFFRNEHAEGRQPRIDDAYRYVIDKDEFQHWMTLIPDWNIEMNIPGKRMKVQEIWEQVTKGEL